MLDNFCSPFLLSYWGWVADGCCFPLPHVSWQKYLSRQTLMKGACLTCVCRKGLGVQPGKVRLFWQVQTEHKITQPWCLLSSRVCASYLLGDVPYPTVVRSCDVLDTTGCGGLGLGVRHPAWVSAALQRLQDETGESLPSELLLAAVPLSFGVLGGRLLAGVFGAKPQEAAAGHELWLWGSP